MFTFLKLGFFFKLNSIFLHKTTILCVVCFCSYILNQIIIDEMHPFPSTTSNCILIVMVFQWFFLLLFECTFLCRNMIQFLSLKNSFCRNLDTNCAFLRNFLITSKEKCCQKTSEKLWKRQYFEYFDWLNVICQMLEFSKIRIFRFTILATNL